MNKYKKLASNTVLISIGTFGSKLLTFFMVRFYTGYLTPADYGTAELITLTATLLFPLISLGITDGVFRFAVDKPNVRKSIFSIGFYTISAGFVLLVVVLPLLSLVKGFKGYLWLIAVYTMCACYHALCAQFVRAKGKISLYSGQGLLNTALVIILNIVFLAVLHAGITGYVLSVALSDLICTAFLVIKEKLWKMIIPKPKKKLLFSMLMYSVPLIPTTIFWWVTSVSDRYMVDAMIGSRANGIYTLANKIPTILTLAAGVFMEAWQFSAVSESQDDKKAYIKFYSKVWSTFMAALFVICGVIIAFSKVEIKILANKSYYEAWRFVPVLCASMIFCSFTSFMGSVYMVKKKSNLSFYTSMIGAIINVVLNLILIPSKLGAFGAALATFFSYLVVFALRAISARKLIAFRLYKKRLVLSTVILCVQIFFLSLELIGWQDVQAVAIILLCLLNFKPLIRCVVKIVSFVFPQKKEQ